MARNKIILLLLLNFLVILFTGVKSDKSITEMVANIRDDGVALFSTVFTKIVIFGCGNVNVRFELIRELSRTFLASNVLDIRQSLDQLSELAWASGYKGQEIPKDAHQLLFILDMDCPNFEKLLFRASREKLFASPFKWLMLQHGNDTGNLESTFAGNDIYPDSDVAIWIQPTGQLLSIYWRSFKGHYIIEDRGYWISRTNQVVVNDKNVISRRRKNLAGTRLRSCVVITHPDSINHLSDYQDRQIDTITKCNYPWAMLLVNMLNATVTFHYEISWGYRSPNGSWDGMIGMLQRGEIDFGATSTFMVNERIGVIQYISLTTPTGSRFIFQRPPLSSVANLFKLPFRNSVWFSICALVVLLAILQYPAMRLEWLQSTPDQLIREPYAPDLSDDLLVVVGSVTQQGSWYEPRTVTCRIIALMGLIAFLSLYSAYTANIVALLQTTTKSITTLKDLLHSPLSLGAHDNVYNRYYFKEARDPVRRAIFQEKIELRGSRKKNWLSIEEGVERLKRGQFAFHVEPGSAYKIVQDTFPEENKCGFHEIDFLNVVDPHFIVQKRSPYLEQLRVGYVALWPSHDDLIRNDPNNHAVDLDIVVSALPRKTHFLNYLSSGLRLLETGLRFREAARLYTKKPVCTSSNRFLSVGLTECYGAFLTLLFGLLVAFGILFLELLNVYIRTRYKPT